jgi:hypothetical protein
MFAMRDPVAVLVDCFSEKRVALWTSFKYPSQGDYLKIVSLAWIFALPFESFSSSLGWYFRTLWWDEIAIYCNENILSDFSF